MTPRDATWQGARIRYLSTGRGGCGQPSGTRRTRGPDRRHVQRPRECAPAPARRGSDRQAVQPAQVLEGERTTARPRSTQDRRHPPADGARQRRQRGGVQRSSAPRSALQRGVGDLVQRVQVLGHQRRPSARAPARTPPPSTSSSSGSTSCRSRTRVNAGSALCGSDHGSDPLRGRRSRCRARAIAEQRPAPRRPPRPHPGDRPRARSAAEPEQHGLGLVVQRCAPSSTRGPPRRRPPGSA